MALNDIEIVNNESTYHRNRITKISESLFKDIIKFYYKSNLLSDLKIKELEPVNGYYDIPKDIGADIIYKMYSYTCETCSINMNILGTAKDDFIEIISKYSNIYEVINNNSSYEDIRREMTHSENECIHDLFNNPELMEKFIYAALKVEKEVRKKQYLREYNLAKDDIIKNLSYFVSKDIVNDIKEKLEKALEKENFEELKVIIDTYQKLVLEHWKEFMNIDYDNFKQGDPFYFIGHSCIYDNPYAKEKFRDSFVSCSLLFDRLMDTYRGGFGFVFDTSNIVIARSKDQYVYNFADNLEDAQITLLRIIDPPERIIEETLKQKYDNEDEKDSRKVYSEVAIDVRSGFKPIAIFCLTDGSKTLNSNYQEALKIQKLNSNLKIIEIDKTYYKGMFTNDDKYGLIRSVREKVYNKTFFNDNKEYLIDRYSYFINNYLKLKKNNNYIEEDIINLFKKNEMLLNDPLKDNLDEYTDEEIKVNIDFNYNMKRLSDMDKGSLFHYLQYLGLDLSDKNDKDRLNNIYPGLGTYLELYKMMPIDYHILSKNNKHDNLQDINQALINEIVETNATNKDELVILKEELDSSKSLLTHCEGLLKEKKFILDKIDKNKTVLLKEVSYSIIKNIISIEENSISNDNKQLERLSIEKEEDNNKVKELDTKINELNKNKLFNMFKIKEMMIYKTILLERLNTISKQEEIIRTSINNSYKKIEDNKNKFYQNIGIEYDTFKVLLDEVKDFNGNHTDINEEIDMILKEINEIKIHIFELEGEIKVRKNSILSINEDNLIEEGYSINKRMGYIKVSLLLISTLLLSLGIIILTVLMNQI